MARDLPSVLGNLVTVLSLTIYGSTAIQYMKQLLLATVSYRVLCSQQLHIEAGHTVDVGHGHFKQFLVTTKLHCARQSECSFDNFCGGGRSGISSQVDHWMTRDVSVGREQDQRL